MIGIQVSLADIFFKSPGECSGAVFCSVDQHDGGIANISDAAQILIAAARICAGEDSGLTDDQKNAADVNADGSINASDAALILQYAAAIGAGSFDGNLELHVREVLKE